MFSSLLEDEKKLWVFAVDVDEVEEMIVDILVDVEVFIIVVVEVNVEGYVLIAVEVNGLEVFDEDRIGDSKLLLVLFLVKDVSS